MSSDITPSSSHNADIETQAQSSNRGGKLRASSLETANSRESLERSISSIHTEERFHVGSPQVDDQDTTKMPHSIHQVNTFPQDPDTLPPSDQPTELKWEPWKASDPLLTKIPESNITKEGWVKVMDAADDGMCKGWREQIDTLIIFAGLFSATVTAFTVESYQWLQESPSDTLARLQLRQLLSANQDQDNSAPATFEVSSTLVAINTLWFASLTLSLAAVIISILCKQWLYEYQRYDNFTTDNSLLIHGLRYRGLQAWRVPEIISSLPLLLQTALVSFLIGILLLLWSLENTVAVISTIIIGLTFLFLIVTTALPSIQYIFPKFHTQCAYKSSQSWTFLFISTFWLFDFAEFTTWASFDQWEVTRVCNGMGHTLFRVYKLLGTSFHALISIYSVLADRSLNPFIKSDITLLSDFIDGMGFLEKGFLRDESSLPSLDDDLYKDLRRANQLPGAMLGTCRKPSYKQWSHFKHWKRYRAATVVANNSPPEIYHSQIHMVLSKFLSTTDPKFQVMYNRCIEHWVRSLDTGKFATNAKTLSVPHFVYYVTEDIPYDSEIAQHLVQFYTYLFKTNWHPTQRTLELFFSRVYQTLQGSYHQQKFDPLPASLLKEVQEWIHQMPDSEYDTAYYSRAILEGLGKTDEFLRKFSESHTSDLEKQYLTSFMRFFVALYEKTFFLQYGQSELTERALTYFREYLDKNPVVSS